MQKFHVSTNADVRFSAAGVPNAAATFTVADFAVSISAGSGYVEVQ